MTAKPCYDGGQCCNADTVEELEAENAQLRAELAQARTAAAAWKRAAKWWRTWNAHGARYQHHRDLDRRIEAERAQQP